MAQRNTGAPIPVLQLIYTEDTLTPFGNNEGATRAVLLEETSAGGPRLPVQRELTGIGVENPLLYTLPGCVGTAYSAAGPGALVQQYNNATGNLELFRVTAASAGFLAIRGYRSTGGGACVGANTGVTVYTVTRIGLFPGTLGNLTLASP